MWALHDEVVNSYSHIDQRRLLIDANTKLSIVGFLLLRERGELNRVE